MESLDPGVVALARGQHGMLTTAQLTAAGLSTAAIGTLVAGGVLQHPGRGLYAVATLSSDEPRIWHRQLVAGAFLLYPDAVLTGVTALMAKGLPVWGASIAKPHLLRPRDRTGGMSAFRIGRAAPRQEQVQTAWGPCTPLAESIVRHAMTAGIVPGVVSADAALHANLLSHEELAAMVDRVRLWPHSNRASAMLSFSDGRRESVGESRSGVTLGFGGIELVPQVVITDERGRFVARVDFMVKGTRVIVEFDGKVKYAGDDGTALFEEKKREDRLRSLGYIVVRIVWADLETPGAVVAKVRRAMAAAA
jgi:very-short-patch-repair endonuclease